MVSLSGNKIMKTKPLFDFMHAGNAVDVKEIWRSGLNFRKADTNAFNSAKKIAFVTANPNNFRKFVDGKHHSVAAVIVKLGFTFEPVSLSEIAKGKLSSFHIVWFPGGFGYFPDKKVSRLLRELWLRAEAVSGFAPAPLCLCARVPLIRA